MSKLFFSALFLMFLANLNTGQIKTPTPAAVKPIFAESLQAIAVTTSEWAATSGTAQLYERDSVKNKWKEKGKPFNVIVGRNGMAWGRDSAPEKATEFKQEGDGRSPAGLIPLTFAFGSGLKPDASKLMFMQLESSTECVDDPDSAHYNRIVDRNRVGNFDWKSSEKMSDMGKEYEFGIFAAHNSYPVKRSDGSCIFLHVWKDDKTPTSGCTAMEKADLLNVLNWLDPSKNPFLIQLPAKEYKQLRKQWQLP